MTKPQISAPFNITISLALVLVGVMVFALMLGIVPDGTAGLAENRVALCETIAVNTSLAIQRQDLLLARESLAAAVERNPNLHFAAVRRADGEIIHHEGSLPENADSLDKVVVPVSANHRPWGTVHLRFSPLRNHQFGLFSSPLLRLVMFVGSAGFLVMYIYMRRVLEHLDPTRVIPERVRTTLDTLAEGLVVIDENQKIVLANTAFAKALNDIPEKMVGREIDSLPWERTHDPFPWATAMETREVRAGNVLRLIDGNQELRTFRVNSAPILGDDGQCQGALTSFDDVTALEKRTLALTQMLDRLKTSRDKIRRQNEELHLLATRDPLTTALNRRSFFDQLIPIWKDAANAGKALSCAMVDIDHFKSINDNHGHAMGDYVLKKLVELLTGIVRDEDLVCRYGGEEFCVVFPSTSVDDAFILTEEFRLAIAGYDFNGLTITASFGVSGVELGASDLQKMIDQADQALYYSKRTGRNRVRTFDDIPEEFSLQSTPDTGSQRASFDESPSPIPFQTVASLLSALAYRDVATAEHSRRVADLCVRMADGLISCSESYVLENAALLHDIGKIGVPDNILLKPGPLTKEEWAVMRCHDEISVEIIRSTFACDELTEIVNSHHSWFGGKDDDPGLPVGEYIPLGARILSIADSFDAMVSDRVYRRGIPITDAFAELRRCAGTQFDPHLVERFIAIVGHIDLESANNDHVADKRGALQLGIEIESLARAIDNRDVESLRALAERVHGTAEQCSIQPIVDLAVELQHSIGDDDDDWLNTLELTIELIELCRQTQRIHINTTAAPHRSRPGPIEETIEAGC